MSLCSVFIMENAWPHQVMRYQKWVLRLCVDASSVKVNQLDFFIFCNHDVWCPKVPEDIALIMQDIQSTSDLTHKSWYNPLHLSMSCRQCTPSQPFKDVYMRDLLLEHQSSHDKRAAAPTSK